MLLLNNLQIQLSYLLIQYFPFFIIRVFNFTIFYCHLSFLLNLFFIIHLYYFYYKLFDHFQIFECENCPIPQSIVYYFHLCRQLSVANINFFLSAIYIIRFWIRFCLLAFISLICILINSIMTTMYLFVLIHKVYTKKFSSLHKKISVRK